MKRILLLLFLAAPAWGQFELYLVNGNIEQPIGQAYSLGNVEPGLSVTLPLVIRNISAAPATLDLLSVNGTGFSLAGQPLLPAVLASEQQIDFTVEFQSAGTGSYSAALESVGISVILSAIVPVELTCQAVTASGLASCAADAIAFGSVVVGTGPTLEVILQNETSVPLIVPAIAVSGAGFSLYGATPFGTTVQPSASVALEVQFTASAAGAASGTLLVGNNSYALSAGGFVPPLPQPELVITLAQAASDQQGTVAVNLSAAAEGPGSGTVTLSFVPASGVAASDPPDPGIAFASGGQSATFAVLIAGTRGDFGVNQFTLPFSTGTTAGTLTVTVQLGSNTAQQSIAIQPAVVGVTAAAGVVSANAVEVDLTGFDNTRTASALSFTFYDSSGNPIGAAIPANGFAAFSSYFGTAAGGTFELKAVFPVVGSTSQIAAFQASVTNSAGTAQTAITSF